MPKSKPPRKAHKPAAIDDEELQVRQLSVLALSIAEDEVLGLAEDDFDALEDEDVPALSAREQELTRLIRNALRKKKDAVLYGALEAALDEDPNAFLVLRTAIEEMASTYMMETKEGVEVEVTAFAIPVLVHSDGGLDIAHDFTDDDAFSQLVESFTQSGLESATGKVVMLSHAYDLHEIDRITYSGLQDMVREAASAMTGKKLVERPALQASISGWAETEYDAEDKAVELRFLVGFTLREERDPFYAVPDDDEDAADAFFEARMARYRTWTEQAGPLVKRCMAADPATIELFFLHQDMFYDAKSQALAELELLGVISALTETIEDTGLTPEQVREQVSAVIGLVDVDDDDRDEAFLRINLYDAGALLGVAEKPLALDFDPVDEVDQLIDTLAMLNIVKVQICEAFGPDGEPVGLKPAS